MFYVVSPNKGFFFHLTKHNTMGVSVRLNSLHVEYYWTSFGSLEENERRKYDENGKKGMIFNKHPTPSPTLCPA